MRAPKKDYTQCSYLVKTLSEAPPLKQLAACTAKTAFERRRKLFHAYVTSFKAKPASQLWPAHNGIIISIYHTIWSNFVGNSSFLLSGLY